MSDGNDRCTQCDCARAEHGECPKCAGHVFVEPPVCLPRVSGLPDYVMRPFPTASIPTSPAGRLAFAMDLLLGFELVDDDGVPTGERSEPMITVEQFMEIMESTR